MASSGGPTPYTSSYISSPCSSSRREGPAGQHGLPEPTGCGCKRGTEGELFSWGEPVCTQQLDWPATSAPKHAQKAHVTPRPPVLENPGALGPPSSARDNSPAVGLRSTLVNGHTSQKQATRDSRRDGVSCEVANSSSRALGSQNKQNCQRCVFPRRLWLRHTCRTVARSRNASSNDARQGTKAEERPRRPAASRSAAQRCPSLEEPSASVPLYAETQREHSSSADTPSFKQRPRFPSQAGAGAQGRNVTNSPRKMPGTSLSHPVTSSSVPSKAGKGLSSTVGSCCSVQGSSKATRAARDEEEDTCGSTAASICSGPPVSEPIRSLSVSLRSAASVQKHVHRVSRRRVESSSGLTSAQQRRAATPLPLRSRDIHTEPSLKEKLHAQGLHACARDQTSDEPGSLSWDASNGVLVTRREQPPTKVNRSRQQIARPGGEASAAPADACMAGSPDALISNVPRCVLLEKRREATESDSRKAPERQEDGTQSREPPNVQVPSHPLEPRASERDLPALGCRSRVGEGDTAALTLPRGKLRQQSPRRGDGQRLQRSASAHSRLGRSDLFRNGTEERQKELHFTKTCANEKPGGKAVVRDIPQLPDIPDRPKSAGPRTGFEMRPRPGRQCSIGVGVIPEATPSRCGMRYGLAERQTGLRCNRQITRDAAVALPGIRGRNPCHDGLLKSDGIKYADLARTNCSTTRHQGEGDDAAARRLNLVVRAEKPVRARTASPANPVTSWRGYTPAAKLVPDKGKAGIRMATRVASPASRDQSPAPAAVRAGSRHAREEASRQCHPAEEGEQKVQGRSPLVSLDRQSCQMRLAESWIEGKLSPTLRREIAVEVVRLLQGGGRSTASLAPDWSAFHGDGKGDGEKPTGEVEEMVVRHAWGDTVERVCSQQGGIQQNEKPAEGCKESVFESLRVVAGGRERCLDASSEITTDDEDTSSVPRDTSTGSHVECQSLRKAVTQDTPVPSHILSPASWHSNRTESFLESIERIRNVFGERDPVTRRQKLDKLHAQLVGSSARGSSTCVSAELASATTALGELSRPETGSGQEISAYSHVRSHSANRTKTEESGVFPMAGRSFQTLPHAVDTSHAKLAKLKADLKQHMDNLLRQVRIEEPLREALTVGMSDHAEQGGAGGFCTARRTTPGTQPGRLCEDACQHTGSGLDGPPQYQLACNGGWEGRSERTESLSWFRFPLDTIMEDDEGPLSTDQELRDPPDDELPFVFVGENL
ncbi:hypothetical protein CSUI_008307 [Cystoisospora suis]|uniref:Uncharacterized protein n=1 Tax=Cystoisospora suis TaxID=483139 RepID=A0A2C6KMZ0_9APIC|nr:hypothetical protein CSUI_008307 [Cystoisospora suis]